MITLNQISIIEGKLERCPLCEDKKRIIRAVLSDLTEEEAYELIRELDEMELDPITSGWNYSQTDIIKHLKKII